MRFGSVSKLILVLFMCAAPAGAQDVHELIANTSAPLRIFLDSDIGSPSQLGFIPPSRDFGASFEYPLWRRLEIQGTGSFSPDHKQITHNGHSYSLTGTAIIWPWWRVGVLGGVGHGRLWTSQFTEGGTNPTIGVVIRTHYVDPGRLYFSIFVRDGLCMGDTLKSLYAAIQAAARSLRFDRNSRSCLTFDGGRRGNLPLLCSEQ